MCFLDTEKDATITICYIKFLGFFFSTFYVDRYSCFGCQESSMQHDSTVDELHKITLGLNSQTGAYSHMQLDHCAWWLEDKWIALACGYISFS
jgi:hypothetical protein